MPLQSSSRREPVATSTAPAGRGAGFGVVPCVGGGAMLDAAARESDVRDRLALRLRTLRDEYRRERDRLIDAALLVDAAGAGSLLSVSARQWRQLAATDRTPAPIKLGGAVRWHLAELAAWIEAGCPDRETWEAMK